MTDEVRLVAISEDEAGSIPWLGSRRWQDAITEEEVDAADAHYHPTPTQGTFFGRLRAAFNPEGEQEYVDGGKVERPPFAFPDPEGEQAESMAYYEESVEDAEGEQG